MVYDTILISVAVLGAYWAWYHASRGKRLHAFAVGASAAAAGLRFFGERAGWDVGPLGVIGLGAAACLMIIGPLARVAARRAAQSDRLKLSSTLLEIADVLLPGLRVGDDKLALAALRDVRAGRIEDTVNALEHGKTKLPPELGREIDERIAMLYLSAHRWGDAVAHVDRTLTRPGPDGHDNDPWSAARASLGMSPPLWVEMLAAVARQGDLDRAATMLRELETVCADRPDAFWLVHRGRLVFLAFAGRVAAVERLVARDVARHMTPSARAYWRGVAAAKAGDARAAEGAYNDALLRARGRARELVIEAIDELPRIQPVEPSEHAADVAREAEIAPLVAPAAPPRKRKLVTPALLAANLAVAVVAIATMSSLGDAGVVVRSGAILRGAIDNGEIWRLVSCVFVHIGIAHLVINMLGLWAIGRWSELVFGSRATLAIYGLGGITGATASYLAGNHVSAGASGAILGLLAALLIELALHRKAYRVAWQSGLAGAIVVVSAVQIGIGFSFAAHDQWAHGGGFLAGAIAGIALSPHRKRKRLVRGVATAIAAVFAVVSVAAAVQIARTDFGDTLDGYDYERRVLNGIAATVPSTWLVAGDDLLDRDMYVVLATARKPDIEAWFVEEEENVRRRTFSHVAKATSSVVRLPDGWVGRELIATADDDLGGEQRYRVIAAGRPDPSGMPVVAAIYIPDALAVAAAPRLARVLASIEVVAPDK